MRSLTLLTTAALVLASTSVLAEKNTAPESRQQRDQKVHQSATTQAQQRSANQASERMTLLEYSELSQEQIEQLQQSLQDKGHYQGNIDGIVGPKTIAALQNYQEQNGMAGNGALTPETASALGVNTDIQRVSGRDDEQGVSDRQTTAGREATRMSDPAVSGDAEFAQIIMDLQRRLHEAGYYQGEVDGMAGPMTRSALQRYYDSLSRAGQSPTNPTSASPNPPGGAATEVQ